MRNMFGGADMRVRWKGLLVKWISGTMLFSLVSTAQAAPTMQKQPAEIQTIDDQFTEIANRLPGFGGLFLDQNDPSLLHIYLKNPSANGSARLTDIISSVMGQPDLLSKRIIMQNAQYDFRELKNWQGYLGDVFAGLNGIIYTDVDESKNRLEVGVLSDDVKLKAVAKLAVAHIPEQAVHFEITSPIVPDSLTTYIRPVRGGLGITTVTPGLSNGGCTLGVNATRSGVAGFITASHCGNPGAVDSTYYQPDTSAYGYLIGPETVDPIYWAMPGCPAGYACRNSDSNFSRYELGVTNALGKILTDAPIPQPSEFTITEKGNPGLGDTVHMVGMVSGWKSTTVSATCVTIYPGLNMTGKAIFCATRTPKVSTSGDSGGPWFVRLGTGTDVRLVGIHHGHSSTDSYYTTISNVEKDLGTLSVCAPGYGC